jgi:hypothetical protein
MVAAGSQRQAFRTSVGLAYPALHRNPYAATRHVVDAADDFGVLTRKLLRRGDFTSREDLETRITAFTIRHNKRARTATLSYRDPVRNLRGARDQEQ